MHFADLHDTPGRMKAKGVIRKQVQWADSRAYFYWRLTRRLREFELYDKVMKNIPETARVARKAFVGELKQTYAKSEGLEGSALEEAWDEDRKILTWLNEAKTIEEYTATKHATLQVQQITSRLQDLLAGNNTAVLQQSLQLLSAEEKALLQAALK